MRLRFADDSSARVYRETIVDRPSPRDPCVLVVAFRLRAVRGRGHAAFRAESLLNTPLFVGFPGFVSKLWLAHDEHGVYRGLYQWDGAGPAESYARALWWVLALVCPTASIRYTVLPGLRRDDLLSDPRILDSGSTADAARVVAAGRGHVSARPDVLVVGAGPTGLALALQAHAHGAGVRVVERRADPVPAVPGAHRASAHAGGAPTARRGRRAAGACGHRPVRPAAPGPAGGPGHAGRARPARHRIPASDPAPPGGRGGRPGRRVGSAGGAGRAWHRARRSRPARRPARCTGRSAVAGRASSGRPTGGSWAATARTAASGARPASAGPVVATAPRSCSPTSSWTATWHPASRMSSPAGPGSCSSSLSASAPPGGCWPPDRAAIRGCGSGSPAHRFRPPSSNGCSTTRGWASGSAGSAGRPGSACSTGWPRPSDGARCSSPAMPPTPTPPPAARA